MGKLLKYILIAVVIGLWIYLVGRSCNTPKNIVESTTNSMGLTNAGEGEGEATAVDENDLEDLYVVEESDVKDGNADQSDPTGIDYSDSNTDATLDSENITDNALAAGEEETAYTDTEEASSASEAPTSANTYSGTSSGSTFGKYLVVTGSYLSEANGKVMAKKLRRLGYEGAEVLSFDLSQYYSVTAGRYNDLGEARAAAKRIKSKGIEAYVHKMRGKKVRN